MGKIPVRQIKIVDKIGEATIREVINSVYKLFIKNGLGKAAEIANRATYYVKALTQFYDGSVNISTNRRGYTSRINSSPMCLLAFLEWVMIGWQSYLHGQLTFKQVEHDIAYLKKMVEAYEKGVPVSGDISTGFTIDVGYIPMREKDVKREPEKTETNQ